MRDELITKWKNSLVLNDEKELFDDIESKVYQEDVEDNVEILTSDNVVDNDNEAIEKFEEEIVDIDDVIEVDTSENEINDVPEVKDEIETLEPVAEGDIEVEKELLRMERKKFEIEKSLAYERIQLEIETLKQEREKFDRIRRQYDKQRRLNEESFQESKLEFEKYKELEMQKLQLETKEMLNNCHNFKNFFDSYNSDNK